MHLLDEVWMVVLPSNKGVVYAIGSSAREVWQKIIQQELLGSAVDVKALKRKGYRAKKVSIHLPE